MRPGALRTNALFEFSLCPSLSWQIMNFYNKMAPKPRFFTYDSKLALQLFVLCSKEDGVPLTFELLPFEASANYCLDLRSSV